MTAARARGGVAAATLGVILAITIAWWALALWPGGSQAPDWLLRTRLACFGASGDALPNAGGWVLLIGEPLGMLAVLQAVWGDALARDLAALRIRWWGRALLLGGAVLLLAGAGGAAGRCAGSASSRRTFCPGFSRCTPAVTMASPACTPLPRITVLPSTPATVTGDRATVIACRSSRQT